MTWAILIGIFLACLGVHNCYTMLKKIFAAMHRQTVLLEAIKAEATSELRYYRPQAVRIVRRKRRAPEKELSGL